MPRESTLSVHISGSGTLAFWWGWDMACSSAVRVSNSVLCLHCLCDDVPAAYIISASAKSLEANWDENSLICRAVASSNHQGESEAMVGSLLARPFPVLDFLFMFTVPSPAS